MYMTIHKHAHIHIKCNLTNFKNWTQFLEYLEISCHLPSLLHNLHFHSILLVSGSPRRQSSRLVGTCSTYQGTTSNLAVPTPVSSCDIYWVPEMGLTMLKKPTTKMTWFQVSMVNHGGTWEHSTTGRCWRGWSRMTTSPVLPWATP